MSLMQGLQQLAQLSGSCLLHAKLGLCCVDANVTLVFCWLQVVCHFFSLPHITQVFILRVTDGAVCGLCVLDDFAKV